MSRVEARNLHFSYNPGEKVIKDINIVLDKESTAIIGQNGAGKTTLVKLLKGLLKPSSGDIFINGKNTKDSTVAGLAKDIGLVFQNPNDQIFKGRVLDEVMFGPINIGQTQEIARKDSIEALKMVGLEERVMDNPYDLGLSERKLISIASILAMNTDIIIFDEPTIGQDYKGKEKIKGIIRKLRKSEKLVITIIHDMDFVAETFERVVVFQKGEVLLDGTAREVFPKAAYYMMHILNHHMWHSFVRSLDIWKPSSMLKNLWNISCCLPLLKADLLRSQLMNYRTHIPLN